MIAEQPDEDALRRWLEQIVPNIYGSRAAITAIHRKRFESATSYACDTVTVRLASGEELKVFLKDFGTSSLPKDGMKQRRERELRVYRDLLAGARLDTARYYGSVWDEKEGRYWLLLEFVDGTPLRYCGAEYWIEAGRWLGRMQGYFAQGEHTGSPLRRVEASDFLVRHDSEFFWTKAELALEAVSQISAPLANRLATILSRYNWLVLSMTSQPTTLVHGSCRPRNILVGCTWNNSQPARICPIDWELAALGAPLYDLAFISDGFGPPTLDLICGAYKEEIARYGLAVPDGQEMKYMVDCFRLHKVMKSLSDSVELKFSESTVATLVDQAESLNNVALRNRVHKAAGSRQKAEGSGPSAGVLPAADRLLPSSSAEHPAVRAWVAALREAGALRAAPSRRPGGRIVPRSVETLQEKWKAAVYRLEGVGLGGSSVIAKRSHRAVALVERAIYEEILPRLPVSALRYYGFVQEDDEYCWLFIEDAGGERYSPLRREHREHGARWLGFMHTYAQQVMAGAGRSAGSLPLSLKTLLPDRGPSHYLGHLRSARREILQATSEVDFDAADLAVLRTVVSRLDALEAHWSDVEMFCDGMPATLVHGDFRRKNVFVRSEKAGMAILPTDWETAGWGVPAIDVAQVDRTTYWPVVRQWWPGLDEQDIHRLARVGQIFQWLAAVGWASINLAGDKSMASMRVYQAQMPDPIRIVRSLGQGPGARGQGSGTRDQGSGSA